MSKPTDVNLRADMYDRIKALADQHAAQLKEQVDSRMEEMKNDDTSHHLIYKILGVSEAEGYQTDIYQNKGRFLYKYVGSFLEEAAILCFKNKYEAARKATIENPFGDKPRNFGIDCLVGNDAHEIKWRDATTDGDHITKERARIKAIVAAGYTPIRIMFYYPQREQAQRIQRALKTLYDEVGGAYYHTDMAWEYIKNYTGVDLLGILKTIAG